ncbi:inactive dipeptidyl peptidase 10-like [Tetranychus urticae]|nr:inactive dipeptidyl peptidase 10-like [Tetranychus urticae]
MNYSGSTGNSGPKKASKQEKASITAQDPFEQEPVAEEEERNWKGICIAFFVIATIFSFIVIAIIIVTPDDDGNRVKHPRLVLEDIVSPHLQPKKFDGSWITETEVAYRNHEGNLVVFDCLENSTLLLVPNTTFLREQVDHYRISADKKFVLFINNIKKVFQYSFIGEYKIYNISNEQIFTLEVPGSFEGDQLEYAEWGPTGNQLIFVFRNNIYYYPSIGSSLKLLTQSGRESVYNGIPDWLYGEKILKTNKALWWSPYGDKLAYASFDDTGVDTMTYPRYGSFSDLNNIFPQIVSLKYPRAGRMNPTVSVWIIDLKSLTSTGSLPESKRILPPSEMLEREYYFTALSWIDNQRLALIWMRREQNYSVVSLCSAQSDWICSKHLEEKVDSETKGGWVEMFEAPLITKDKRHYLLTLPLSEPESGSFRQIVMITINGRVKNFLTQGQQDVTQILAHRHDTRTVFYAATLEDNPGVRHIFSIPDIHSSSPRNPYCLTCNQTERNCSFNDAQFNPTAKYYILQCLGAGIPWTEIRDVDQNEILLQTPVDKRLKEIVEERAFPQMRSFRVPISPDYTAEVRLILPPALRESEEIKFPLIIEVGPEPGNQDVNRKFNIDFGLYLASNRSFIYARVDVRGTRFQGNKVLHEMYHKLGSIEVDDYIKVVNHLKHHYHFIDPGRIAIWGWAYGGYVAAAALVHGHESIFNCSIAVAPITNWLYVDSFTAERYFGGPWVNGNYARYQRADLSDKAHLFRGRNLFILHGTADDAVHLQHSFSFMKSLNSKGVYYRTQVYPDSNHYLEDVRYHLYHSIEIYLAEMLGLQGHHSSHEK